MSEYDYKVHPLAALFPEMSAEEFKKLKNDIQAHGQREPIMVTMENVLLDGRHRLRACKELGISPAVQHFPLNGMIRQLTDIGLLDYRCTETDYIWSKNVLRRHLTDDQRAAIAVKFSDAEKEASKQRQLAALKKGEQGPVRVNPPERGGADGHATRNALAQKAQTSPHKIKQAETVKKNAPELLNKVAAGETKLRDAAKQTAKPATSTGSAPVFEEQAALARLYRDWEGSVFKHWPTNRELTPVIRKVYAFATYLEKLEKVRAAELQRRVQSVGVQVGAR